MADVDRLLSSTNALLPRSGGLHPPPDVIAKWPKPNYIDPEERGWEGPIVILVVMAITIVVYISRIWARLVLAKSAGLDDLLISFAMLPCLGLTISVVLASKVYGFQWHAWDQTNFTHITTRELTMAIELNYLVSTTLIKISILCFYRRMSGSLKNAFLYWVWGSIIFCAIYGILFVLLIIFTCTPVVGFFRLFDFVWRLRNELACHDEGAIIVACAIISTVQDLVICLLPVLLIRNLKMPIRQKAALCAIFAMGLITCICGILRTYYATYVYYYTYDITWYAYYGWIWTALETDLGLLCACAPAMKVFFHRYFSSTDTTQMYGYSKSGTNKTPIELSRTRGKPINMQSSHSAMASYARPESDEELGLPFQGIKVSQNLAVQIEERDDVSHKSFTSTQQLTALPQENGWKGSGDWVQGCRAVCAALKPGSRSSSRRGSCVKAEEGR